MTITLNGRIKGVGDYKKLTYSELIVLAYGPTDTEQVHTITYFVRGGSAGSVVQGQTVKLKRNMVFNVIQTNKG